LAMRQVARMGRYPWSRRYIPRAPDGCSYIRLPAIDISDRWVSYRLSTGSTSVTVVPCPSILSRVIRPCIAATSARAIASPRPLPPPSAACGAAQCRVLAGLQHHCAATACRISIRAYPSTCRLSGASCLVCSALPLYNVLFCVANRVMH
jgi:hypothetical protein